MEIKGKTFCFTGKFETKQKGSDKTLTRNILHELIEKKDGIVSKSVTKNLDYLVVGGLGSSRYIAGSKGKKIIKAEKQLNTKILTEEEFLDLVEF